PDIPKAEAAVELPKHIATMFPEFLSFIIAFLILASFWIVHHEHFHYLKSVNGWVLWLNIFILIFVVLVPFSTNLSGDYSHVMIAPLIFHLNMLALGILFLVQWQYIIRRPALLIAPVHPGRIQDAAMERFSVILAAVSGILFLYIGVNFSTMYMYAVFPIAIRLLMWYLHTKQEPRSGTAA
ncbi:MAG: TMEM175 family protein, partial [Methanoregula sp.]|nr:TMEM175 family protein [Methanoregula sp.]